MLCVRAVLLPSENEALGTFSQLAFLHAVWMDVPCPFAAFGWAMQITIQSRLDARPVQTIRCLFSIILVQLFTIGN